MSGIPSNPGAPAGAALDETGLTPATPRHDPPAPPPVQEANVPPGSDAPAVNTLRKRAIRGSLWAGLSFAFNQVFRFGSNLMLVWLLVPEAFGLMAVVNIFMAGLQMFSDLGVRPAIIHSKRGEDPAFLNTAWTISVVRGIVLWIIAAAAAWPASLFWYPQLKWLLPVAGLTAVINGLNSTAMIQLHRRVQIGWVTMIDVGMSLTSIAVMVTWAWISPTVWALVAGSLTASAFKMAMSHLLPGARNRLQWDRSAAGELFSFGRWITLSTIISFFAAQIDKLTFSKLMPAAVMGVFWQGFQLAEILPMLSKHLGAMIGFPVLADLARRDHKRFLWRLKHLRMILVLPINGGLLLLIGLVQPLVHVVYPLRFNDAGWIAQVLAVNSLAGMVNTSYGHAFLATGNTFSSMITVASILVVVTASTLTGYALDGADGFIVGIGVSQWIMYPVYYLLAKRCGFAQPKFDLPVLVLSAIVALGLLWGSSHLVHLWFMS